jgi:hypothetical protein
MQIYCKMVCRLSFRLYLIGVITGLVCQFSYGQSGNDFSQLWQESKIGYLKGQHQNDLLSRADFYNYARIRDEEFSECLKESWRDYSILPGILEEPHSTAFLQPVFNYSTLDITSPVKLPFSGVIGSPGAGIVPIRMIPRIRKPESEVFTPIKKTFLFYGQQINLCFDRLLLLCTTASVSEDSVSVFWESFSRTNSNGLVDQLMDYRDLLGLGDWGYFLLVKAVSNHLFADNRWRSDQLAWALMIRSGFDVRLAFNQNSTTLLFPSENTIYSRQFVEIGQKRYYLDREMNSQLLVTCPNPFPDTGGMIDLKFYKSLNFTGKLSVQKFATHWNNQKYEFSLRFNPDIIRFCNDYPHTDSSIYFEAPVSSAFKEDVLRQLYPLLSKITKTGAASFLQQFVQREFKYFHEYKKDEMVSGRFAEEVIASKSGDDRGKSVLFSWLVHSLLHLPVVGVQLPGYYTTAIGYSETLEGDAYSYKQKEYIITDPTFLNAPIGMMIPEFSGLTARLIDLSGSGFSPNNIEEIWKQAGTMGAKRGGASQDLCFDRQGRALITGYFADKRSGHPFVASISEGNSLHWVRKFEGEGKASAFAITELNDNEIYIAGSFSGKITMDGKTLESRPDQRELFFAQLNQNGELIWMKSAGNDSVTKGGQLPVLLNFDRTGDHIFVRRLNEDNRNVKTGFCGVSELGLYFTCAGNFSPAKIASSKIAGKTDSAAEMLKTGNFLKRINCHPKVTGIIMVLRWLQQEGKAVTGNQIQKLMTSTNPSFSTNHPLLFQALGRIASLKNENGIVTVKTIDYKSFTINPLRFEDGARFIISVLGNNDLAVNMISGFKCFVNPLTFSLNGLLIDNSSGNMVIDYDHDHTLKTVSIRP